MARTSNYKSITSLAAAVIMLAACSEQAANTPDSLTLSETPVSSQPDPGAPLTQTPVRYDIFGTPESTGRFLQQATFGVRGGEIKGLLNTSASDWIKSEFDKPASYHTPNVNAYMQVDQNFRNISDLSPGLSFWKNAVGGDDQLRQRTAFALSQIWVVSDANFNNLYNTPEAMSHYQDIMVEHAFGNYRDIMQDVTYSPAMAYYLTYLRNRKGNPDTGQMPDENYARELLQLFTIGTVQLELNGTVKTGTNGDPLETYSNADVEGLAKVFTGFGLQGGFYKGFFNEDRSDFNLPLAYYDQHHSDLEKAFLGLTIPANTDGPTSVDMALDHIFEHPNLAPFVSRQLIQRFTTSDPEPVYVRRVSLAFESGRYTLPDGSRVGSGDRGDMMATIAAVLFDETMRDQAFYRPDRSGKIREPVLRFTNWARAFDVGTITPEVTPQLWFTNDPSQLSQYPFRPPSVFNFYRPGYIAPGTHSGDAGMTVPELQLINATSAPGYVNFMNYFIFEYARGSNYDWLQNQFDNQGITLDASLLQTSFVPDYSREMSLVHDPDALTDHLNMTLASGDLSDQTKARIKTMLETVVISDDWEESARYRVQLAVYMVMTSPDYILQR